MDETNEGPAFTLTVIIRPDLAPEPQSTEDGTAVRCAFVYKRHHLDALGTVDALELGEAAPCHLHLDDSDTLVRQLRDIVRREAPSLCRAIGSHPSLEPPEEDDLVGMPLEIDVDAVLADRTGRQFPLDQARRPAGGGDA